MKEYVDFHDFSFDTRITLCLDYLANSNMQISNLFNLACRSLGAFTHPVTPQPFCLTYLDHSSKRISSLNRDTAL